MTAPAQILLTSRCRTGCWRKESPSIWDIPRELKQPAGSSCWAPGGDTRGHPEGGTHSWHVPHSVHPAQLLEIQILLSEQASHGQGLLFLRAVRKQPKPCWPCTDSLEELIPSEFGLLSGSAPPDTLSARDPKQSDEPNPSSGRN